MGIKPKVLFLGTPEFACPSLNVFLENSSAFDLVGVVSQPDRPAGRNLNVQPTPVKKLAQSALDAGQKFKIFSVESVNEASVISALKSLEADVAVVVAFGQILRKSFLEIFKFGAVNIHASLLPRWRGAAPIAWSVLEGDKETGVTLQKITSKLDAGDIIASEKVNLDQFWDAAKLYEELSIRGGGLLRHNLATFLRGEIKCIPQDETKVTLAPKIKKEQGIIKWTRTGSQIDSQIRALTPWPGTWTKRAGKTLKILKAKPIKLHGHKPGVVVEVSKTYFTVQCGSDSGLEVSQVQPESRSRLDVSEYLKGNAMKTGEFLE